MIDIKNKRWVKAPSSTSKPGTRFSANQNFYFVTVLDIVVFY